MEKQPEDGQPLIDPLRRVFIPVEHQMSGGDFAFRTLDREAYVRDGATGVIRRMRKKISKKERRRAHAGRD